MRNICSSPEYAAGGWKILYPLSVRLKGTMTNGRFNLIPRSGLEPTVRIAFIQLIVPQSAKCFYRTMVKHCALTKINDPVVVVRLFIGTQNRLVALHSAHIKAHEEEDISPHSVIYRPVGSTMQLVTKLSSPNVDVLQGHRYLEPSILGVQRRCVSSVNILIPSPLTPLTVYRTAYVP
jgi:hypothetical protein